MIGAQVVHVAIAYENDAVCLFVMCVVAGVVLHVVIVESYVDVRGLQRTKNLLPALKVRAERAGAV